MRSAPAQLWALLSLRWRMVRGAGSRASVLLAAGLCVLLLDLAVGSASALSVPALATAVELAPAAFLGFGLLALIAPLTAGGGSEIVPSDQLVAFPVRPVTHFTGGLLLAPVNLVWVVQLLSLMAITGYLTVGGDVLRGAVTTTAYVVCVTVLGQALAWTVVGLRQTRNGRRLTTFAGAAALLTAVAVVRTGHADAVLEGSGTRSVVAGVVAGGAGASERWVATTAALLLVAAVGVLLGARACGWALRRPADARNSAHTSRPRRRRPARGPLRELIAMDRASVWRAPALRRGGLVLAVLPGLVAAGTAVPWESLAVLPGLVAAGAGLLFGINMFCLDASGAVWLASQPSSPSLLVRSKLLVLTETVLAAVVLAVVAGIARAPGMPTAAELTAVAASGVTATVLVVALCLRSSVRRPHRAELRGPRDAVAPPGALMVASAGLAIPTALLGIVLAAGAATGLWWMPLLLAVPVLLSAGLSMGRSLRRYADPVVHARLVSVVSTG
jgi:hypothetical protein